MTNAIFVLVIVAVIIGGATVIYAFLSAYADLERKIEDHAQKSRARRGG